MHVNRLQTSKARPRTTERLAPPDRALGPARPHPAPLAFMPQASKGAQQAQQEGGAVDKASPAKRKPAGEGGAAPRKRSRPAPGQDKGAAAVAKVRGDWFMNH